MRMRRIFFNDGRCLDLFFCQPDGLAERVPSHRPLAPQAECAEGAYASPKTFILAKFGFVLCVYCKMHVLRILMKVKLLKP